MALSTTFTHCAPETTKIGKISQSKAIYGHRFWYQSKAHIRLPSVINTNLPAILHRLRDIAFETLKIAIRGATKKFCNSV